MRKIIIIGGGAAGMTAAIAAARTNKNTDICILEKKDILGKKLLSTGNGRCNFTNARMDENCFFSDTPGMIPAVLERFGTEETLQFFTKLGILPKSRNGYYYPQSDQASAVPAVLRREIKCLGIQAETGCTVTAIQRGKKGFRITTEKEIYHADRVILTTGGKAASVLGSDGSGYSLAKGLGHSIVPVVPALVQLKMKNHVLTKAAGVRADAKISLYVDGKLKAEDTGELQLTAYGISGIPVFQISRFGAKALSEKKLPEVKIDFLPVITDAAEFFGTRKSGKENQTISEFLVGIFNQKLIPCLLRYAGIRERTKVCELTDDLWRRLISACKEMTLQMEDTNGFDNAQVCAGGVRLDEIDIHTMESRLCGGLYLAGELLDVDGLCGGYNLQWAWASGYIAGESAAL